MSHQYQKYYLEHCGDSTIPSSTLPDINTANDIKTPIVRILPRYGTVITPLLADSFLANQYELNNGIINIQINNEKSSLDGIGVMGKDITYTYKITLAPFYLPRLYENENDFLGIGFDESTNVSQLSYKYVALKISGFDTQGVSTVGNLVNPLEFHFLCNIELVNDVNYCNMYYKITPLKEFEELTFSVPQMYINSLKLELSNLFSPLHLPMCRFTDIKSSILDSMNLVWNSDNIDSKYYGELILGYDLNLPKFKQSNMNIQNTPIILNKCGIAEFINNNNINAVSVNFNINKYISTNVNNALGDSVGDTGFYELFNRYNSNELQNIFNNLAKITRVKYYANNDIVYYNPLVELTAIKNYNIYYDSYNVDKIMNNIYIIQNDINTSYYIKDIKLENYNDITVIIENKTSPSLLEDEYIDFIYGINDLYNVNSIFGAANKINVDYVSPTYSTINSSGYCVPLLESGLTKRGIILCTNKVPIEEVYLFYVENFNISTVFTFDTYIIDTNSYIGKIINHNVYNINNGLDVDVNNINIIDLKNYSNETKFKIFTNQYSDVGLFLYLETAIDDYYGISQITVDINWDNLIYNELINKTNNVNADYLSTSLLTWYTNYLKNNISKIVTYKNYITPNKAIYEIDTSYYWAINDQSDFYWRVIIYKDEAKTIVENNIYLGFKKINERYLPIAFVFNDPSSLTFENMYYFNGFIDGRTVDVYRTNTATNGYFSLNTTWNQLGDSIWYTYITNLPREFQNIINNLNRIEFLQISINNMIICDQRILILMKMNGYNVNTSLTNACLPVN